MGHLIDDLAQRLHLIPMPITAAGVRRDEFTHCSHSPFEHFSMAEKEAFVIEAVGNVRADRAVGCLVGMAVADGLGCPLEFTPAVDEPSPDGPHFDLARMFYQGAVNRFRLQPGQWTDDSRADRCAALCLAFIRHRPSH